MRKPTEGQTKAHRANGYCKHLRRFGKRQANKAGRKYVRLALTDQLTTSKWIVGRCISAALEASR